MKAVSILVFTAICGFVSSQISRLEDFGSQKDAGNFRFDSDSKETDFMQGQEDQLADESDMDDYECGGYCKAIYSSCKDALQATGSAKDGAYYIKVSTTRGYVKAYCRMTSLPGCSGGGWTLAMKTNGAKTTFSYSSPFWKNKKCYNIAGGLQGLNDQETKLPTYWSTSFTELCVGMKVGKQLKFVSIKYAASSLYDLIADGQYHSTNLGRMKWKSLITGSSLQRNCNREGFNVGTANRHARVRIGIIGNQENDCGSADSYIGFGALSPANRGYCGVPKIINTCGNSASCSPDNGDKEIKAMGYIFVR